MADLEAAETPRACVGPATSCWWPGAGRPAGGHRGFDGFSGLHAECLPWLQEREVAVLGSDGISDPMPFVGTPSGRSRSTRSGSPPWASTSSTTWPWPPGERCAAGRWEFLFTMSPLRIAGAPAARSTRWPCCERPRELRGLVQRYARAVDRRDSAPWPGCSTRTPPSSAPAAPRPSRVAGHHARTAGLPDQHARARRPADRPGGRDRRHLDTYAVVYQLSDPARATPTSPSGSTTSTTSCPRRPLASLDGSPHPLDALSGSAGRRRPGRR